MKIEIEVPELKTGRSKMIYRKMLHKLGCPESQVNTLVPLESAKKRRHY